MLNRKFISINYYISISLILNTLLFYQLKLYLIKKDFNYLNSYRNLTLTK